MKTMKGPGLFLAQFVGKSPPLDTSPGITRWAADCGYLGVQLPSGARAPIDLDCAASSDAYCDELDSAAEMGRGMRAEPARRRSPPRGRNSCAITSSA